LTRIDVRAVQGEPQTEIAHVLAKRRMEHGDLPQGLALLLPDLGHLPRRGKSEGATVFLPAGRIGEISFRFGP
jgi:hypothetical protein